METDCFRVPNSMSNISICIITCIIYMSDLALWLLKSLSICSRFDSVWEVTGLLMVEKQTDSALLRIEWSTKQLI